MGLIISTDNGKGVHKTYLSIESYNNRNKTKEQITKENNKTESKFEMSDIEINLIRKIRNNLKDAHNETIFRANQAPFKIAINDIDTLLSLIKNKKIKEATDND